MKSTEPRKVFFNREINYLTDAVSVNQENTDSYCVMMTDWDTDHLILEKKSKREGLISKSYTRLSEEEFERILDGDYEWMASARESIFRDFYLQLTINQLRQILLSACYQSVGGDADLYGCFL